jgi:hypothetical protein
VWSNPRTWRKCRNSWTSIRNSAHGNANANANANANRSSNWQWTIISTTNCCLLYATSSAPDDDDELFEFESGGDYEMSKEGGSKYKYE